MKRRVSDEKPDRKD